MADLLPLLIPGPESPISQRPGARLSKNGKPLGRPPKSENKVKASDLARYIQAQYGTTPGQQLAQLALVTPAQIRRAKAEAIELGIDPAGLEAVDLAHLVKAKRLAKALGVTTAEAYAAGHKARVDLLPYIHQRQPQAAEDKSRELATVFMVPSDAGAEALSVVDFGEDEDPEILQQFEDGGHPVGHGQSDEDA